MISHRLRLLAAAALVAGGVLGLAGTFSPPAVRGIAWGLDGTLLVLAAALLAVHHFKLGHDQVAAGFLVFLAGQALVDSCSAMELSASSPLFAAGAGLWAAALALISAAKVMPVIVRVTGAIAAVLFAVTALQVDGGTPLTALSKPLPFNAYPFLVLTVFGWAWILVRSGKTETT